MPGFNIEDFKSELNNKKGAMRNNKFLLTFATPQVMLRNAPSTRINRTIEFWCESVNLPGYQLMQHDVRRWTYGPSEKRPFAPNFQSLQCSFIADGEGVIWDFFSTWMQKILPHDTSNGINALSAFSAGSYPYELDYKSNYATDLNILVFGEGRGNLSIDRTTNNLTEPGVKLLDIICVEAFPSQVVDINLNWGDTNNIAKIGVVFEYRDWFKREGAIR